ncbi:MAG: hypothetical protein R2856_12300 [Caldilineaceae bacterium]
MAIPARLPMPWWWAARFAEVGDGWPSDSVHRAVQAPFGWAARGLFHHLLTMAKDDEKTGVSCSTIMDPVLRLARNIKPVGLGLFAGSLTDQQSLTMKRCLPQGRLRNWDRIRKWAAEISLRLTDPLHDDRGSLVVNGAVLSYDPSESRPADLDADSAEGSKAHVGWANLQSSNLRGQPGAPT